MIVLDTSVLSEAFRRRPQTKPPSPTTIELNRIIDEDVELAIPGIVLQELLSGVKERAALRRLDNALSSFPLLIATRKTHVRAAIIANACTTRGIATSTPDCLIAAHAILSNASLFSTDADFARMAPHCGLKIHRVSG